MDLVVLGWPPDGPRLQLDYRRFSYAGKFVMTNTGKAVVREESQSTDDELEDDVLAAAAFNEDRTDDGTLWIRYVTVRDDRRGDGLGSRLCAFVVDRAAARGYDCVRIAVNNPFAYEALYRAGFAYTGETTGIAELILERPAEEPASRTAEMYKTGLDVFRERDLSENERQFLERRRDQEPPEVRT